MIKADPRSQKIIDECWDQLFGAHLAGEKQMEDMKQKKDFERPKIGHSYSYVLRNGYTHRISKVLATFDEFMVVEWEGREGVKQGTIYYKDIKKIQSEEKSNKKAPQPNLSCEFTVRADSNGNIKEVLEINTIPQQ